MNKFLTSLLAIALLAGAQAHAEDSPPPNDHGPGKGAERFKEADANKDGYLTKDEMLKAHEQRLDKMFERVDADKDGKLSKDELQKGREDMRAKMKERFKDRKAAKDGDAKSTEDKAAE